MMLVLTSLAILVVAAALSLLFCRFPRFALGLALSGMAVSAGLMVVAAVGVALQRIVDTDLTAAWPMPLGTARLEIDGLSAWFLLSLGLLSLSVAVYSWGYMRAEIAHGGVPAFGGMLCLLTASLVVVVCAADAVLFLVGWEGMTLCAFFLVGFHDRDPEARRGAWMYLIATHLGTALCVLPLFAFLIARAGTADFGGFRETLAALGGGGCTGVFLLGLIGFGTKAGFMPMHVWLPVAHPIAPTPVSAFLSGIVIKTGIYALLRLLTWLPPLPPACAVVMLAIASVSGVLGVLYALAQHDLKRLLAYHSVENIGIIGLGIGVGMLGQTTGHVAVAVIGYSGALLHVLNHAMFKGLLFLSAGAVIFSTHTGQIDRLGGLVRRMPSNAFLFLIGAVAICGLPPLNGFVSEWLIYGSLFGGAFRTTGFAAAAPVVGIVSLTLMGGLALACFAKVYAVVFLGAPRDPALPTREIPTTMTAAMGVLAVPCIAVGLLPSFFLRLLSPGVQSLVPFMVNQSGAILDGLLAPAVQLSILAAVFLALVAGLALVRRRLLQVQAAPIAPLVPTWGCGYPFPTPRMQYTASSFAWSLVASFRGLLWPERHFAPPEGVFPSGGSLETHTADLAEQDLFSPLFRGVARVCTMIKTLSWSGRLDEGEAHIEVPCAAPRRPFALAAYHIVHALRRGSIHVYLGFIVLTLITLFLIEAVFSSNATSRVEPRPLNHTTLEGGRR